MPLTSISEERDEVEWAKEVYPIMKESCEKSQMCEDQGWSILLRGLQATVGDGENALIELNKIPDGAYTSAGGNGHSKTNSVWWIATRPDVIYKEKIMPTIDNDEGTSKEVPDKTTCRYCTHQECSSLLNRCSLPGAPFLCLQGVNVGGCSQIPWNIGEKTCLDCCELLAGC
jgi:hypothetical protein